jgi:hypothetical protein
MEANDVVVKGWTELLNELYDIQKSAFHRYRSDFVYRGVADQPWGLETSLQRLGGDYVNVEGPMLRQFPEVCGTRLNTGRYLVGSTGSCLASSVAHQGARLDSVAQDSFAFRNRRGGAL